MPWWIWVLAALAAAALFVRHTVRSYRRGVRQRFVAYLRVTKPETEVIEERDDALRLRTPSGQDGVMYLGTLFTTLTAAAPKTPAEERDVFARFLIALTEHDAEAAQPLSLDACADRLFPRLVPPGFFANVPSDANIPHTPADSLGLEVAYVLDGEHSVRYLTAKDVEDLGMTVEALHERAMVNLAKAFSPEAVRHVADENTLVMVKEGDSFDATRLLLVPEHLQPGEEIVALIPDRDTLALLPMPANNDWTPVLKLARTPASDRLILDRPVRVTCAGFQLV